MPVRVGTCGFCTRQRDYYAAFDVVEVQRTFYKPPKISTAQRWRAEAPEGFHFTMKAFQAITHPPRSPAMRRAGLGSTDRRRCGYFRDTPVVRRAWKTTHEIARALDARLVVFQCPASFRPTDENVDNLIRFFQWAHRDRLTFGWEPRGEGWSDKLVRKLCVELSLVHVVDPFRRACLRPRPPYYRLHGVGGHGHVYTGEELDRLLEMSTAPLTYCLFNNRAMAGDAARFLEMAEAAR